VSSHVVTITTRTSIGLRDAITRAGAAQKTSASVAASRDIDLRPRDSCLSLTLFSITGSVVLPTRPVVDYFIAINGASGRKWAASRPVCFPAWR
jgi:hypothetical protein